MSQTDRVLAALKRAGPRGITQIDFDLPDVIDGGTPIKRIAARVHEIRKGLEVTEDGWRQKCRVYVYGGPLNAAPVQAVAPIPDSNPDADATGGLFDIPAQPPANEMWAAI